VVVGDEVIGAGVTEVPAEGASVDGLDVVGADVTGAILTGNRVNGAAVVGAGVVVPQHANTRNSEMSFKFCVHDI
jgi:hypothetical protein